MTGERREGEEKGEGERWGQRRGERAHEKIAPEGERLFLPSHQMIIF